MELSAIRPTQFGAGFREVEAKAKKLRDRNVRELKNYLESHPVEGILGPGQVFYAVDGHHFALAAQMIGLRNVYVDILKDYSDLNATEFWKKMIKGKWVYLYKLGEGPFHPRQLPKRLEDMIDDPYRSLASAVRKLGGFEKSDDRFSEFPWAEFFRQYVKIENGELGFQKAVHAGYVLAKSPLARNLLGFIGEEDDDCVSILSTGTSRR